MLGKLFLAVVFVAGAAQPLLADNAVNPQADFKAFRKYFTERFPKVPLDDFVNGPYSMDEGLRKQWKAIDEFPPYQFARRQGQGDVREAVQERQDVCRLFPGQGRRYPPELSLVRHQIRRGDHARGGGQQMPRENGEKALDYARDDMAAVTAYMAFTSRGKPFDIKIPDDPRALAAYKNGEEYFYTRRGQLNFSCASCHVQNPGNHIRTEVLAPALGITAALPIYRSNWGGMGTTTRRLRTCNSQVGGEPLPGGDKDYRDVEYFLSYMANGLPISGPGARP